MPHEKAILLTNMAFQLVEQGRIDDALLHLFRAIEIDPGYGHAYNELAFVYARERKQLQQARAAARKATECDSAEPKFHNSLFHIALEQAKQESSPEQIQHAAKRVMTDIDALVKRHPDYAAAWLSRAKALALMGKPRREWMGEIKHAQQLYQDARSMSSGRRATSATISRTITRCRQECRLASRLVSKSKAKTSREPDSPSTLRVFFSYSVRSKPVGRFVESALRPVFDDLEISYFDYNVNSPNPDARNEFEVFEVVDQELARANVFLRLFDRKLAPPIIDVQEKLAEIRRHEIDFLNDYEVDRSMDFPATSKNRVQIMFPDAAERYSPDLDQTFTIWMRDFDDGSAVAKNAAEICQSFHRTAR